MTRTNKERASKSTLRIIGGQWRGRKLSFTPAEGLRPTPDRVRETLFNWLAPSIQGARCLDLFAGSGALGLEALSRGAASCDFVDTSTAVLREIGHHLQTLHCPVPAHCHATPALAFLHSARGKYDIVFLDPPFGKGLLDPVCAQLAAADLVAKDGLIYVETALRAADINPQPSWRLHREKVAGEVRYRLFTPGEASR